MYSEMEHIFFSSMSSQELFLIKDDKEDLSNFEIVKRPTLKFQSEISTESLSSSSESHSQDKKDETNDQEKEESHQSRIVSKQSDSEASTASSGEQLKVEDEEDGFRTPTSLDHRIPVATQCPPAPIKSKPSLKRKAFYSHCNCRSHPLDLSKEGELLFPTQQILLSDSHQSTKKVRREEPN